MLFFVYGTLMEYSGRMTQFSPEALKIDDFVLDGAVIYSLGGYPGLILTDDNTDSVKGEVWFVPDKDIPKLDRYESEGYLYLRQVVTIFNDIDPVSAYIYNHDVNGCTKIPDGNWLQYINKANSDACRV